MQQRQQPKQRLSSGWLIWVVGWLVGWRTDQEARGGEGSLIELDSSPAASSNDPFGFLSSPGPAPTQPVRTHTNAGARAFDSSID
jgi:hypothetical protein